MANPRGTFAPELLPEGWFDETIRPEGWFSQDFLEPPASGGTVTGSLVGTIQPAGAVAAKHGVAGAQSGVVAVQASIIATHGVAGPELGTIALAASFTGSHGVSGTVSGSIVISAVMAGEHGSVADQGGPGGYRTRRRAGEQRPSTKASPLSGIKTRPLPVVAEDAAVLPIEAAPIPPVFGVIQGDIALVAAMAGTFERRLTDIEKYLKSYGIADYRAVAVEIRQALKTRIEDEQPKAIIRSVLAAHGVTGNNLRSLTVLIYVAWDLSRTIILEAA